MSGLVLKAFGLHSWDVTSAVRPPLRVRVWRAVTFARRRGRIIDWSSYEAAEAEASAATATYRAALPGRAQEAANALSNGVFVDLLGGGLPGDMWDRLQFEWVDDSGVDDSGECAD